MDKPQNSLFEVFLRLRPSVNTATEAAERFLDVEDGAEGEFPKHITIKPPANDHRKRAVERFAFTRVFEEAASQLDVFNDTGVLPLVEGVLGADGRDGRDGLLATLGVTGSGKVIRSKYTPMGDANTYAEPYNTRNKVATRLNTTRT
jgi:hypothetical protein